MKKEVVEQILVYDRLAVFLHERGTCLWQGTVPNKAETEGRCHVTVQRKEAILEKLKTAEFLCKDNTLLDNFAKPFCKIIFVS